MTVFPCLRRSGRTLLAAAAMMATMSTLGLAKTDFPAIIPDNALAAAWSVDYPALADGIDKSAYGKLWADPATAALRKFIGDKITEAEKEALEKGAPSLEEIVKVLKGGVGVYIQPIGAGGLDEVSAVTIIEVDEEGKAWIDEKLKADPFKFVEPTKDSYETSGVTVYRVVGKKDALDEKAMTVQYATLDKHFVISFDLDTEGQKAVINRIKSGATEATLSLRPDLKTYAAKRTASSTDSQANIFVNTGALIKSSMEAEGMDSAMVGVLPNTGLYDIEAVYLSLTPSPENVDTDFAVTTPQALRGIMGALGGSGTTPLNLVALAPADSLSVTSFSLDVGLLYDAVLKIVNEVQPMIGAMASAQIQQQQQDLGVDFINGLVRNIAGEHIVIQRPLDGEILKQLTPEQQATENSLAFFLGFKNGDEASTTIKRLIEGITKKPEMAGMITTEEIDGVTVIRSKSFGADESPIKIAIAFNNKALAIANNEVQLADSIRALNGKSVSSLADTAGMKAVLADVPKGNLRAFSYSPASAIGHSMKQLQSMLQIGALAQFGEFDPAIIPSAEVIQKYFGDSYSVTELEPGIIATKIRILPPAAK